MRIFTSDELPRRATRPYPDERKILPSNIVYGRMTEEGILDDNVLYPCDPWRAYMNSLGYWELDKVSDSQYKVLNFFLA